MRDHIRKDDPEWNLKTRPPDDELVTTHCLWMVEVYPPSHTSRLITSFHELGWDESSDELPPQQIENWIRQTRLHSGGGGWKNLGTLVRPGGTVLLGTTRKIELPAGVEYAHAGIHQVTSSVTCVVVGFVLDGDSQLEFDRILRRDRESSVTKTKRGITFSNPDLEKRRAILAQRTKLRADCSKWFARNLPGLFAARLLDGTFPSCEFTTLRGFSPYSDRPDGQRAPRYVDILDIHAWAGAWASDELLGVRIGQPYNSDRMHAFDLILAAQDSEFQGNEKLTGYGGGNPRGFLNLARYPMESLMSRWGLYAAIEGYGQALNTIRDTVPPDAKSSADAVAFLHYCSKVLHDGADVTAVVKDLSADRTKFMFLLNTPKFTEIDTGMPLERATFLEMIYATAVERSRHLRELGDSVRNLLTQYGSIQSTLVNIRLQRHMTFLTWLMAILTIVSVVVAILTLRASLK